MDRITHSPGPRGLSMTAGASLVIISALALLTLATSRLSGRDRDRDEERGNAAAQVAALHDLHASFHEAQSYNADPDLRAQHRELMSDLWADNATLTITDANIKAVGKDQIMAFWDPRLFADNTPDRVSLAPAFRTQFAVHGNTADVYFECHIVNPDTDMVLAHRAFSGTARKVHGKWLFQDIEIGPASL